jgi:hypothetical protein
MSDNGYVLGYSEAEHRRLEVQARLLQPWTEHFFRSGGLREGMTVLDLDLDIACDAIVGRYILLYLPDPAAALRRLAGMLRTGGVLIFHEIDLTESRPTWPACPVWDDSYRLLTQVFRAGGAHPDFGRRLTRTFLDAGLPAPEVESVTPIGSRPDSMIVEWLAMSL